MSVDLKTAIYTALVAAVCFASAARGRSQPAPGVPRALAKVDFSQSLRPSVITLDTEDNTYYVTDTADLTRYAMLPGPVMPTSGPGTAPTFARVTMIGDITTINGMPAKGTLMTSYTVANLTPNPLPGQSIAAVSSFALFNTIDVEILLADGTPIGGITASGLGTAPAPPGAPSIAASGIASITGGTGSFLGIRGEVLQSKIAPVFGRAASVTEDPSNRRINGGGTTHWVLHVIPFASPEVLTSRRGPEIVHADDSRPVSLDRPAHPGETLILFASGLGPTRPGVDPGVLFTADPVQVVNAPVEVVLGGTSAQVLSATGVPGTEDTYQVTFQVPADAVVGLTGLNLRTAWMAGHPVELPVR